MLYFAGFAELPLNDQMRLLQGTWVELLTLTLAFRSLPTTITTSTVTLIDSASSTPNGSNLAPCLRFAADFVLEEHCARECNALELYQQVSRNI